jgi:4-amino-4-deoxy-L-arabinose transferase-like glycosyltransferase
MPLIFRCFGDFKLPLYIYLTVVPVFLFGLNAFSARFVSIIAGTFSILLIYLILQKIYPKNKFISIFGALIFCLSPVTIFLSRIALEANLFMCLFLLSFYFLLKEKYVLSTFVYGLSLLTYNSSRVLLPFYLISLTYLLFKNKINFKKIFPKFIPFILFVVLAVFQTLNQSGQARYQWVSILDSGSINQINELRATYPRILVNKVTYFTFNATKNYLSHFNPQFLFVNGGSNYQFSIPGIYLLSPLFLPFLILGLIYLFKNIKNDNFKLILFFFLVSPLPSAITRDAPHVLRSIIFFPFSIITISLGFSYLLNKFKKISWVYLFFALGLSQIFFWPKYFSYARDFSSSWQYGYSQTISYVKDVYNDYDQIIFTKKYGEAHEFILFYWPWNPLSYQTDSSKNWDYHATWYWINAFDKFSFINDWEIKDYTKNLNSNKKTLLITSPNNYNEEDTKLLKTINFLDNSPAFQILEIEK